MSYGAMKLPRDRFSKVYDRFDEVLFFGMAKTGSVGSLEEKGEKPLRVGAANAIADL